MVKTLTLRFENGEYKMLAKARDLCDAESWEKFFLIVTKEWASYEGKGCHVE